VEAKSAEQLALEAARSDAWVQMGNRADLRCAIRVVFFEICLVRIKSTLRNPEIVEVSTYVPSQQRRVERVLMHKSLATRDVWHTTLKRQLRRRAQADYTKETKDWLRARAAKAKELLEHNRDQYHVRAELVAMGQAAVRHNNDQKAQREWLRARGAQVVAHLHAQAEARKQFGMLARRVWAQQARQRVSQNELRALARKVQGHLLQQRAVLWQLIGKAAHIKVLVRHQAWASSWLREQARAAMLRLEQQREEQLQRQLELKLALDVEQEQLEQQQEQEPPEPPEPPEQQEQQQLLLLDDGKPPGIEPEREP
jgi:hypothetical protein